MAARSYLRVVYAVARKDLVVEARSKRTLNAALMFALLVVVVFSFVFSDRAGDGSVLARGALWLAVVFSGAVGMSHAVAVEGRNDAMDGLLLAPVDRSAVYLGKVLSTSLFVTVVGAASTGFVAVFLDYSFGVAGLSTLAVVVPVAATGFSAVGVLLAVLMLQSPLQESLLPVLLTPLVVPVILAGTALTRPGIPPETAGAWLRLLVSYAGIVLTAGWMTFSYLVEE